MNRAWQDFADEIARWNDAGKRVDFWWRDDDAAHPDAAFERLSALAGESRLPLALAVIPQRAEPELFAALGPQCAVLQHGVDHRSRAAPDEKPCEFPATGAIAPALARIAAARDRLAALAGPRFAPVLVPPWNRCSAALVEHLPGLGIRGFSTFAPRPSAEPAPGVRQVNTHVDVIAWKRGRTFVGEERALREAADHLARRRAGTVDAAEPTGWLTHHQRHDDTAWAFLARLFEVTGRHAGVRWMHARDLFLQASPA